MTSDINYDMETWPLTPIMMWKLDLWHQLWYENMTFDTNYDMKTWPLTPKISEHYPNIELNKYILKYLPYLYKENRKSFENLTPRESSGDHF